MRKKLPVFVVLAGLVSLLALLVAGLLSADSRDYKVKNDQLKVEVSITNLTRGQIMSPVFVTRHDGIAAPLYALGKPASGALAKMAEDADSSGLMEVYGNSTPNFGKGPIMPGQTVSANFEIDDGNNMISFVSMLVSTNDAFIGANNLDLSQSRTIYLNAYDSGSEANSEDCAYIPGPPCGNHAEDDADSEGYVHVHAGVHGGAGLTPAMHDWRNPAARLVVKSWKLSH